MVNLKGFATFESGNREHAIKLEPGFEMEVSKIREKGWFEFSFPRPAVYKNTLQSLAKTLSVEKSKFYEISREFQPVARDAVAKMSEFYHLFAERRMASHKAYLKRMKKRQLQIKKLNSEMRAMFRKENYLE